ncbi:MAG TPA: hypothetical protein VHJ82_08920 [Actinomycetota bacterium]|nr:hypothetical protein [Actinomycetota bacterium]
MTDSSIVPLEEGWYLLSAAELERVLRGDVEAKSVAIAQRLRIEDALGRRNAGNLPDEKDRSLRLVLHVRAPDDLKNLPQRRLAFEPDFHDAPVWRREGSRPVNVVPVRVNEFEVPGLDAWWEDDDLQRLEQEWASTGSVRGVRVPAAYRGFVYKTVLELERAGRPITAATVAQSVARWLPPNQSDELLRVLLEANSSA